MKPVLILLTWAATAAIAGPYDQPWSIIGTDTARSADPLLRPVIVNRVDGVNSDSTRNESVVAPGKHEVTIDLPPRKGFHQATQATFELQTEPCTRYYVAARLDNQVTQDWKPFVRSTEAIGECRAKFKLADKAR